MAAELGPSQLRILLSLLASRTGAAADRAEGTGAAGLGSGRGRDEWPLAESRQPGGQRGVRRRSRRLAAAQGLGRRQLAASRRGVLSRASLTFRRRLGGCWPLLKQANHRFERDAVLFT